MSTSQNILSQFGEDDQVEVLVEDLFIEEYEAPLELPEDGVLMLSLDDDEEEEPITKREGRRGVRPRTTFGLVAAAAFAAAAWCFARAVVTGRKTPRFARFSFAG